MSTRFSTTELEQLRDDRVRQMCNNFRRDVNEATKAYASSRPLLSVFRRPRTFTYVVLPDGINMPEQLEKLHWQQSAITVAPFASSIDDLQKVIEAWMQHGFTVSNVRHVSESSVPCIAYDLVITGKEPDPSTIL